ncbi:MAG: patatin-like phospholipase family protein [Maricaulaceae bacterium]|nr:patatin-like phospholipase family protein [Maricaulaceae bacterium]
MAGNVRPIGRREAGILQKEREKLNFHNSKDFKILSLDGGGIKGLYTSAFLQHMENSLSSSESISDYFDLIAGTSTGGIIALALAAGVPASDVHDLYTHNGKKIFKPQSLGIFKPKCSAQALVEILKSKLQGKKLRDVQSRLCIPSANHLTGENVIFKTPHHPDYIKDAQVWVLDVALATSAAPTFLPAHQIGKDRFLDGAVVANNPVMVALVDALSCFNIERRQIKILSISPGEAVPEVSVSKSLGGMAMWLTAYKHFVFHGSKNADGQAGLLIGRDRLYRYMPPDHHRNINMDDYRRSLATLAEFGAIDAEAAKDELLTEFFSQKTEKPVFFH